MAKRHRKGQPSAEPGRGTPGRGGEPAPPQARADEASAEAEEKDIVQLGSEGSFPASDPPSWMGDVDLSRRDAGRGGERRGGERGGGEGKREG